MTGIDHVLRSGDGEQGAGGQASSTQAWMERYKRHTKPNDRKWRTKSMRRAAGEYLASSKFGDEVVSKVLLLARWRNKARKHLEDRAFSMAARRPWLARFQAISERCGCVIGAGMEYDGINPHVEMILQVSRAEEDRRLDLAAEQRARELTPMDAIQERVRQAMHGVKLWTETGGRTVGSDDDGIGVRSGLNTEGNVGSGLTDNKGSSAGKAAARRASLLLRGPRTAIVPVDEKPIHLPVMRPQLPYDAIRAQEHLAEAPWPRKAPEGDVGAGDNAWDAPAAGRRVMAVRAPELTSLGPASAALGDQLLQETAVWSPSPRQSAPGSQPPVMDTGGAAGGARAPSAPSSPRPPPTPQRQAVPGQQDKIWPDRKDLVAAGLDSYLSAVAPAAAAVTVETSSPTVRLHPPATGQFPVLWQTRASSPLAGVGTGAGETPPAAQRLSTTIPSSLLVPSLSPPPFFHSQQQQQQEQEQSVTRLQSHTPELGRDEDPVAATKDEEDFIETDQPRSREMIFRTMQNPNASSVGGGVAPSPLANAGSSLREVAPSLGGLDMCRVATAAPTFQGGGRGGAAAPAAALVAATSSVLSKQVRGGPLPHSLTMTRRGRRPALPDPAMAMITNAAGRLHGAQASAASASLVPSLATGSAGNRGATGKAAHKLRANGAAAGATAGSGGDRGAHGVMPHPLQSTSSRLLTESRTVSFVSRHLDGDVGHKHTAVLSMVDAALFWNAEVTSPHACGGAASGGESPLSRAGTISRLHSLRPSPLPLVHPPLPSPDLIVSSTRLFADGTCGDTGGSGRHETDSDSGDSDDDCEVEGVGDGGLTPTSPVSSSRLAAAGLLSATGIAGTAVTANRSTLSRSQSSWPGAPSPSATQLPRVLHPEAPPSPSLTRATAGTQPQRFHPLQAAAGLTAAATVSIVANPDSPTLLSPVINSPSTARYGINATGPFGKSAAATTAASSISCSSVRTSGLASPALVLLADADSPSLARREATRHQPGSANEVGTGLGPSSCPVMPALSRSIRLEAEDMSSLYGLRRSVQPDRASMSMSSLPHVPVPPAHTQQIPNGSPTRLRQPYSFPRVTLASGTELEERYGGSVGAAAAAPHSRSSSHPLASTSASEFAPSRFPNDGAVALPDAVTSIGHHASVTRQRGTMSGPQPRLFLPELRSTSTAGAPAALLGMADTPASPV